MPEVSTSRTAGGTLGPPARTVISVTPGATPVMAAVRSPLPRARAMALSAEVQSRVGSFTLEGETEAVRVMLFPGST